MFLIFQVMWNGQQITVESEYAKTVESRFGESATDAIEQVMKNIDVTSNKTAVDALNKAKGDYEQARKAVEEKARKENERKQDEAIRTLKYYISHFTDNWNSELEYSNYEILNQKDKPITRSNDSRIKKMIANSEAVIQKYADKLQEIMDKLNEIGEQKRADKVPDPEIVEIADLIIDCYEKLHMKAEVEIYGEPDVFKSTIDKKYSLMSSKWKRIRKAQPSIRAGEIQEELEDLQRELREAKKTLASAKRKCTMLRPAVTSLEETYEKKRKLSETANQELESRRPQYETELLEVTGNIEDAQEKRNKLNARIETLNKDTSEIKRDYSGRIQEITKEKYAEEAVLKELVNKRIPLINIEKQARNRVSGAVLFKKKKQDEADAAAKKLNDANLIIDEKTSAINILSQKIDSLKTEMEQKLDALNGEIKSAEKERNDVMQHLAELEGKADSLKNALGQYEDAAEFAADEMLEAKVAFNNKRKELEKLEQELAYDQKDVDKLLRKIEKTENEIKELKSSASNPAETVAKSRSGKATKKTET